MIVNKYAVVVGPTVIRMSDVVNDFLKSGWEPFGSMVYAEEYYHQPIIKRDYTSMSLYTMPEMPDTVLNNKE